MREVVAKESHVCQKCGEIIEADEVCVQSETRWYAFWHSGCYQGQVKPMKKVAEVTA